MDIGALKQIIVTLTTMVMSLQATLAGMPASSQLAQVSPSASITLSPSTASAIVNNTFTVNIVLNTGGQVAYGADVNRLRFNPSILQVVDADAGTAGVQIAAGALMPLTIINSTDNTGGSIQFSQLATPGSTYNGSGTLATVTFRAIGVGTSNATFDFTLGSGTDTNVAGLGGDLLSSVGSGSYSGTPAPDTTAPTTPGTPALTVISSSQINLSWTASTDAVGVTGYRVERCSGSATCTTYSQIATPTTNSYSNTGLTASTIYRYRIRATDAAGNLSSYSTAANATTQAPPDTTAPTISSVASSGVTTSGATITWTTNENADTQVEYGPTASYGSQTTLNTSMVTSHSATLSGLSVATLYHYRVKSRDAAGNLATGADNTFTTSALLSLAVQRRIILVPEGMPANQRNVSGTVEFLNPTNLSSKVYQASFTANSSGQYTIDVPAGLLPTVTMRPVVSGYLSKLLANVDLRNTSVLDANFPTLPAGDFNNDQLVNSLDFSYMNGKWGSADALADVNRDGAVNSLDFAFMSNNWLLAGE